MENFEKNGIKYTLLIIATTAICMMLCFLFMFKCESRTTSINDSYKFNDINNTVDTIKTKSFGSIYNAYNYVHDTVNIKTITVNSLEEYIRIGKRQKTKHISGLNAALKSYVSNDFDINKTNFFDIYGKSCYCIDHIFILTHIQFNYEIGNSPFGIECITNNDELLKNYFDYIDKNFHIYCDSIDYKYISYYKIMYNPNYTIVEYPITTEDHIKRFWEIFNHIYLTTIAYYEPIKVELQMSFENDYLEQQSNEFWGNDRTLNVLTYYDNFYFY